MKLNYLFFAFILVGLQYACSSEEPESFNYQIAIMSPDDTDKLEGDSIHIHINFDEVDMKTIHNVEVSIENANEERLYHFKEHVHEMTGHYEHHADFALEVAGPMVLKASVWSNNSSEDEHSDEEHNEEEHANSEDIDKVETSLTFNVR